MLENDLNTILTILFRLVLAILLAFIPGIEREITGKFAGLRTHIMVCLGACIFTIISLYGFQVRVGGADVIVQNDPARLAAQVITGIGFIGAGTVMRQGVNISGITTAATLWVCAAIGMCCGCGAYITAILASLSTLIVLITIRRFEKNLLSKKKISYSLFDISITSTIEQCDCIQSVFENNFHKIYKYNKKLFNNNELKICATIVTKKQLKELNELFREICPINSIEIREHYEQ